MMQVKQADQRRNYIEVKNLVQCRNKHFIISNLILFVCIFLLFVQFNFIWHSEMYFWMCRLCNFEMSRRLYNRNKISYRLSNILLKEQLWIPTRNKTDFRKNNNINVKKKIGKTKIIHNIVLYYSFLGDSIKICCEIKCLKRLS